MNHALSIAIIGVGGIGSNVAALLKIVFSNLEDFQ